MRKTTKKKIAPMIITAIVVLYMIPLVMLVFTVLSGVARENLFAALVLLIYGVFGGAVVVGVIRALLQRLDEIDRGEEEEASQY